MVENKKGQRLCTLDYGVTTNFLCLESVLAESRVTGFSVIWINVCKLQLFRKRGLKSWTSGTSFILLYHAFAQSKSILEAK